MRVVIGYAEATYFTLTRGCFHCAKHGIEGSEWIWPMDNVEVDEICIEAFKASVEFAQDRGRGKSNIFVGLCRWANLLLWQGSLRLVDL